MCPGVPKLLHITVYTVFYVCFKAVGQEEIITQNVL